MVSVLSQRYQLGDRIGQGGSAEVYRAHDLWLARQVAIKIARTADPIIDESLAREFGLLFRLDHPHLASAFDHGRLEERAAADIGLPSRVRYVVMGYCPGPAADRWRAEGEKAISLGQVILVAAQIASALAALHARGVVHRDVKPGNIVVGLAGRRSRALYSSSVQAQLIDFGLARRAPVSEFAGTPRFMAPEALTGEVDSPADVYSFGATVAALVQSNRPSGAEGATQVIDGPLRAVVEAATHQQADKRPTAAELFAMLLDLLGALDSLPVCVARQVEDLNRLREEGTAPNGFIGQDEVRRAILSLCGPSPVQGGSQLLRINGAAGSGKTAALAEAMALAALHGIRTLGGIHHCAADQGASVRTLQHELRCRPAAAANDWALFADIAEGLRQEITAHDTPVLLLFDDVEPTSLVYRLGRYLQRIPPLSQAILWLETGVHPGPADSCAAVSLRPLTAVETGQIVASCRPLRPHDKGVGQALWQASGGNPGRVRALLHKHTGDDLLRRARDDDWGDGDAVSTFNLTVAHRRLATIVAFFPGVSVVQAGRWTNVDDEQASLRVGVLREMGILAPPMDGGLYIAGEWLTDNLCRAVDAAALADLGRLTTAEQRPPDDGDAEVWQRHIGRVHHALGNHRDAAEHLRRAATSCAAPSTAVKLLRLASDNSAANGGPAFTDEIHAPLGRLLLGLGRDTEAVEVFKLGNGARAKLGHARALIALGNYSEATIILSDAAANTIEGTDAALLRGELKALHAHALLLGGRHKEAKDRALAVFAADEAPAQAVQLKSVLGLVALYQGDLRRAREQLQEAVSLAQSRGRTEEAGTALAHLALVLHKSGDLAAAATAYQHSIEVAGGLHQLSKQAVRLVNQGALYQEQGKFDAALAALSQARATGRLIDGDRVIVRALLNEANLLGFLGDCEQALRLASDGISRAAKAGMQVEMAYLLLVRCEMQLAAASMAGLEGSPGPMVGGVAGAKNDLDRARGIFSRHHDKVGAAECASLAVQMALLAREYDSAEEAAERARRLAIEAGRDRISNLVDLLAGMARHGGAPDHTRDQACVDRLLRLTSLCQDRDDPDIGWLAQALLHHLSRRTYAEADMRADHHLQEARRLASAARSRLSARFERTYVETWYRRELWRLVRTAPRGPVADQPTQNLERLLAINRELALERDPEHLLERVIDAAITLSGAERGFIVLFSDEADADATSAEGGEDLVVRAARNLDRESLTGAQMRFSKTIALEAMRSGVPVNSLDAQQDDRFQQTASVHILKLRSVVCLPLRAGPNTLGALYLDHRHRANAFSAADTALLSAFGDQAAIALANARLVSSLESKQAELDRSRNMVEELNQKLQVELEASRDEVKELQGQNLRPQTPRSGQTGRHGMVGMSDSMQRVYRVIDRIADRDVPVTVLGESGTGKELVARAIHRGSTLDRGRGQARGSFVSVNCAAIPTQLLESELFGHERGAFTGAVRAKPGLFEVAQNGTIFLDEIGDMPMDMQVKLLRVLQQREFRRVGGTTIFSTNARVISATHHNLEELVVGGQFREDLWYRLNVVELVLPPLRQRPEDLPLLIRYFLDRFGGQAGLSSAAHAALLDYSWPGNVRELENELQRALVLADLDADGSIAAEALSPKLRQKKIPGVPAATGAILTRGTLKETVEEFERRVVMQSLSENAAKVAKTARALGLTRAGLYKKIAKYGIELGKP